MRLLDSFCSNLPRTASEKKRMIRKATKYYGLFLKSIGLDWQNDDQLRGTPERVAKMFVNEFMEGSNNEPPDIKSFQNGTGYDGMVFEGNIKVHSLCCHHMVSFLGNAHVAYIPGPTGKIIGLSKLNRIVEFLARRPQVQENLTLQVHNYLADIIEDNLGVAVFIEATHLCALVRGVRHNSIMKTVKLSGVFLEDDKVRSEFYSLISSQNQTHIVS